MENLPVLLIGGVILFLAWKIGKQGKIGLVHDYHYKRVQEEDKPAYCKGMGLGLAAIGGGLILSFPIDLLTDSAYGWVAMTAGMVIGLFIVHKGQMRYNKGWF